MKDIKNYTITVLHELISTSKAEYSLLNITSRKLKDVELKSLFSAYAVEKKEHIIKLGTELGRLGVDSKLFKDDSKILIENFELSEIEEKPDCLIEKCLEKDDLMILEYFNAMRKNIMLEVLPLVARQYLRSKYLHDQIKFISPGRTQKFIYNMVAK